MPIIERDPWRLQYFEGVDCPDDLIIPTEDGDAYLLFPDHRWVYNKLWIAESQDLTCGLHGMEPPAFPVFSKPVYNMRGMGTGSRVVESLDDYKLAQQPGHFWMPVCSGEHVSSDAVVVDGGTAWWRHTTGEPLDEGTFDYWTVAAARRPELESYLEDWTAEHLAGYTGCLNFETVGGRIIECHLRFADQWPDLYGGRPWVEAVVGLYRDGVWEYDDADRRDGYSVVLFGSHGLHYTGVRDDVVDEILDRPEVSSVQITFHEDKPPEAHAMPPGGFRLAIVNSWDLDVGRSARRQLALQFWPTHQFRPHDPSPPPAAR
jgi:hypothetical protein